MITLAVFYFACIVLAVVPLIFVYHKVYKDGIVGRASLLGISFVAILWLMDVTDKYFDGEDLPVVSNRGMCFTVLVAIFLVWHLARFHGRVLRRDDIKYPPGCPMDRRKCPDRRFIHS